MFFMKEGQMKQFVIFDTEYASWDGFLTDTPENKKKAEIVQIAAIKINADDLSVAEELNLYVKPYFRPKLTQYFINLTGITDEILEAKGIGYLEAYEKFKQFAGNVPCYSHGWSLSKDTQADGEVMADNLEMWGKKDEQHPDFRNIAPWFKEQYAARGIDIKTQCSGQVAQLLGCGDELKKLGLDMHNALYDVYSLLAGLRYLGFKLKG